MPEHSTSPSLPTPAPHLPTPADPTRGTDSPANKSARRIVFLVVVIDLLGFGIVLPLLPRYAKDYVSPLLASSGDQQGWRVGALIGLLMASFSAMQFLFAPLWGRLSDRLGRRPILLLGLTGSVIFYALFGYASNLPAQAEWAALALSLIFVARIGAGICGATIATAQAVIADSTPPEERKRGMALIGAAFGIGFTFGPVVGYAALQTGHQGAIGYAAAILSAIALLLGLAQLPETRRFGTAPPLDRRWFDGNAIRMALTSPSIGPVVLVFFLASLGFGGFENTLAVLLEEGLGLKADQSFLLFAYIGLVLVLAQGGLYRPLARKVSEATFMTAGLILMALGLLTLGVLTYLALHHLLSFGVLLGLFLPSLALSVVGFALLTPSAQALISRRTDPEKQGEILGVNQSASALARILGPICGLVLYYASPTRLLPYAFGAGLLLLMLPLIPKIRKGEPGH